MLGIIIVSFCSGDVIEACLDGLGASDLPDMRVVVCDNASPDDTVAIIHRWAENSGRDFADLAIGEDYHSGQGLAEVTLVRLERNRGYAGAVNAGLRFLMECGDVELYWILNPDCIVAPDAARAYVRCAAEAGTFSLMGGRTLYLQPPQLIQSDGGRVRPWSGICDLVNRGREPDITSLPEPISLDFVSGANMVASKAHLERAGLLREDYFLYYEEVDWAARRGDLPLILCADAIVYHHGGTTIGSGSMTHRASAFANYFNYRNRMRFMRRFRPAALPSTWALSMLRVTKLLAQGYVTEANAAFRGLNGLAPPLEVSRRIASSAQELAFGKA